MVIMLVDTNFIFTVVLFKLNEQLGQICATLVAVS